MENPRSSQSLDGQKKDEANDAKKAESNLSGLKHALHGASYQLKLGIVVSLANAKKALDPANDFSFEVTGEDPSAGKFDDIVYSFKAGDKTGILKIQVKHKLGSPAPNITLKDFTTNSDTKNPFAILKYFSSFCDQQQSTTDVEGFVICTNAGINDKAKNIWKTVEPAVTKDSEPSLDSYVASLFDSIGGKYYQLDYDKLWAADGMYSNLYQLLRKCSKRARLAKLLVEATKTNKRITYYNPLFKEYRQAVLDVIDTNETSTNESYGFTEEFIVSSSSNSKPGYEAFRKEFEEQYRQEYQIDGFIWDDLRQKRLYVSKEFFLDEKNIYSSSALFPNDDVDESFKSFCERLRLVCDTLDEHKLDEAITKILRNMQYDDNRMVADQVKGYDEENIAAEGLFKFNFDWLMNPYAKPLGSDDIKKYLENTKGTLAQMKLISISDKLRQTVLGSPFRIRANFLQASDLHDQFDSESILVVEVFDIQFGVTVLVDILELQSQDHSGILFLEDFDFSSNSDTVEAVFRCNDQCRCLVILCYDAFKTVQSTVRKWKKDILKDNTKKVFLIRKTDNISPDLDCFHLSDLTEESWEQFRNESIALCGTTISPSNIFQTSLRELPIEKIIQLLDWGKQTEENNEISKKYREIESTYVHRPWTTQGNKPKAQNVGWELVANFFQHKKRPVWDQIEFVEIARGLKEMWTFYETFVRANSSGIEHEPIVDDEGKKVLILLGEAGFGKSTNLTWLAWQLRKQNPLSWVVRCNLSDHCTTFKPFAPRSETGKEINETEAMRMLYKMICSTLQLNLKKAESFSNCLVFSDGQINVSEELTDKYGLSLENTIQQLVFKEKFNAGELVFLMDGFDEIAPYYKDTVLKFLSLFEQLKGVKKLYLTSRPYGFKQHVENSLSDPLFFQLSPLSLQDRESMLYNMIKVKWHNGNFEDEEVSAFYKSLCITLLGTLGSMSDIPLNLMMAVDILGDRLYHTEKTKTFYSSKTNMEVLIATVNDISRASFTVEEFVKVKIRHLLYDKNVADKNQSASVQSKNVADKPLEMERMEKAIEEAKLHHGQLALYVFFNENELADILTANEIRESEDYMKKLYEGSEKTGIIHFNHDGRIEFTHRTFVEYMAAWWIIQRQTKGYRQDRLKMSNLKTFWEEDNKVLLENIDKTLVNQHHLVHLAIIEREWNTVESLLSTNPQALFERDDGGRTALHLITFYYDFDQVWPTFLPDSIEADVINFKEKILDWTALDYAFHRDKHQFISYLLRHGASINKHVLNELIASAGTDKILKAAIFARYVMTYLSREAVEYGSHDACKQMKQLCAEVIAYSVNETSTNFGRIFDPVYKKGVERNDKKKISWDARQCQ
ncbi:uncharacterized protein LOC118465908 [Anopheles albimanus]|uniref:uncharacterized protein LOC118465908 n=1 Tax=Anopheles albimanus TaxID=7167 RepID=UPI0016408BC6|nr:uncharacterized protein LOC118465908 [Anopheles albimanus]XP_035790492.1 uncharacterized protein LOC118465908 [Anopheles albimanus]